MKRTIGVLALALALVVAGALPAQAAMKKLRFGASFSGLHHPAYATVAKHMRSEAKKLGVDIIITDSQDKLAKQINDLEDMITKGVDVLFVNTVSKGTSPLSGRPPRRASRSSPFSAGTATPPWCTSSARTTRRWAASAPSGSSSR